LKLRGYVDYTLGLLFFPNYRHFKKGTTMSLITRVFMLSVCLVLIACGDSLSETPNSLQTSVEAESGTEKVVENHSSQSGSERLEQSLRDMEKKLGMELFAESWTGDLDSLKKKRVIRVLTVYGLGRYFLDGGEQKGITYEWFKMFEEFVNKKIGTKHLRLHVLFVPVARDQLISGLVRGRGDIVAAGLTITPERSELVDFSEPISRAISEVLVTGPAAPEIQTLDDLSGHKIYVRKSSSYRSSLDQLNQQFKQRGLDQLDILDAPEQLEDEDLLEMVNAGLLEWLVVDDFKAKLWAEIYDNLTIRNDLVFRSGGRVGFAMRKGSPQLAELLNEFVKTHKQGTLHGNVLINRYLKNFDWAQNALSADDYKRFETVVKIFEEYGTRYGVDFLMVAAQGYQESRLDQSARSAAGAIGIMQLLPTTAADPNVGIPDIEKVESNIHAGVKYLNFIRDRYFSDPEMNRFNQTMFAFAAYNAGPARVQKLRNKAAQQGYDPNIWFDNVEVMAAKDIGSETVQYVANILKYYIAYRLTFQGQVEREKARKSGIK
jgi:membrane-bound lytic murein transglycosylase MltF